MIKINLLPQKRAKLALSATREPGSKDLVVGFAAIAAVALVVFVFVDHPRRSKLSTLRQSNTALQKEINSKHQQLKDYPALQKLADEAETRAKAIHALDDARVVPANLLHELGQILTPGQLPTMTKQMSSRTDSDPNRRFDLAWDPRHVWITSFHDNGGRITLDGGAEAEVDIAQFSKRLQASAYFMNIEPTSETRTTDRGTGIDYFQFTITGKVAY